jgi:hypothetical protein
MTLRLTPFVISLIMSAAVALAESYTNLSGEVISGAIATISNGVVTVRSGEGMVLSLALKNFPAAERERILLAAGQTPPLPPDLQLQFSYLRDMTMRVARQKDVGQLTEEEAEQRRLQLRSLWQRTLDTALNEKSISTALHKQWFDTL